MKKFSLTLILTSTVTVSSCTPEQSDGSDNITYSSVKFRSEKNVKNVTGNSITSEQSSQTEENVVELPARTHEIRGNHYHCQCCEGECCGECLGFCCGKAFCCIGLLIIVAAGIFFVINWKTDLTSISAINPDNW